MKKIHPEFIVVKKMGIEAQIKEFEENSLLRIMTRSEFVTHVHDTNLSSIDKWILYKDDAKEIYLIYDTSMEKWVPADDNVTYDCLIFYLHTGRKIEYALVFAMIHSNEDDS